MSNHAFIQKPFATTKVPEAGPHDTPELCPLLQSVVQGRLDTFRSGSIRSPLPHADFNETDQNYVYAWGMDYACGNGVIEKNDSRVPSDNEIDQTIEYFSARKLPFIWWTAAKILETKGFQFGGILTGIALTISEGILPEIKTSPDLEIKIVQSESELKSFTHLIADAFAMNSKAAEQLLPLNNSLMKSGEQVYFMAYIHGNPVGTVSLAISPTSAGIWNLMILPEHRQQGIATALVHATLVEAKKRHCDQIMGILMPKGMAWGLVTKLGFRAICEFPFYVYGAAAEDLEK